MMRRILGVVVLFAVAGPLNAQGNCDLISSRELSFQNRGTPVETAFITQANFSCPGGRRILADNATYSRASGQINLWGNVRVTGEENTMTAGQVQYLTVVQRIIANENAVLRDNDTGSTIHAGHIEIDEKTAQRPESRITATGGVPRAILFAAGQPAGGKRDSTIVDGFEIRLVGESSFRATGSAVMVRDSLRTTGHMIEFTESDSVLSVTGNGRVELPGQTATGDSITATMGPDDEIREVLTRHGSSLRNDDMSVIAPAIRLFFEDGAVSRMVAMNWPLASNAQPTPRARVDAQDFRMDADSIDVVASDGDLKEAVAVGTAYGERVTPDSLKALLPEAETATQGIIANDWMRGDTLRAFFAQNPNAARDTAAAEQILERIIAIGQPAQSVYRIHNVEKPDAKLSISYLNAKRIEVSFANGVAQVVSAEGDVKGIYLQPGTSQPATTTRPPGGPPVRP